MGMGWVEAAKNGEINFITVFNEIPKKIRR